LIEKSPAIVLRTIDFKESSIIATIFTETHGKIAVIAKGARKPKSKFAAFLVPGQIIEAVFYNKSTRSVQTLSDASYLKKLDKIRTDVEKMALVITTMEMTEQLIHENEQNRPVFDFLLKFLPWIEKQPTITRKIFPYVQIRLAQLIGIGLQSVVEQVGENNGYINIESGTLSCEALDDQSMKLTPHQFYFVNESLHSMKSSIFEIDFRENELSDLIFYLDKYFKYHVEGIKPRKSDKIFEQLLMNDYENKR